MSPTETQTLLHNAVDFKQVSILQKILNRCNNDYVQKVDSNGNTALDIALNDYNRRSSNVHLPVAIVIIASLLKRYPDPVHYFQNNINLLPRKDNQEVSAFNLVNSIKLLYHLSITCGISVYTLSKDKVSIKNVQDEIRKISNHSDSVSQFCALLIEHEDYRTLAHQQERLLKTGIVMPDPQQKLQLAIANKKIQEIEDQLKQTEPFPLNEHKFNMAL